MHHDGERQYHAREQDDNDSRDETYQEIRSGKLALGHYFSVPPFWQGGCLSPIASAPSASSAVNHFSGSTSYTTYANRFESGDHEFTLIVPCPPKNSVTFRSAPASLPLRLPAWASCAIGLAASHRVRAFPEETTGIPAISRSVKDARTSPPSRRS